MSRLVYSQPAWILPRGFIGMLTLMALVELYVGCHSLRYTTDHALCWKEFARAAGCEVSGCEVLCFGDSLVKLGVLPQVVEACSGRLAYNLALLNGPPSASYFLLRRALDSGARPKVVVVDFMPGQVARDPRQEEFRRAWPDLVSARECLDLAWSTRDAAFLGRLAVAKLLPLVKSDREIRAEILSALGARGVGSASLPGPSGTTGGSTGGLKSPSAAAKRLRDSSGRTTRLSPAAGRAVRSRSATSDDS